MTLYPSIISAGSELLGPGRGEEAVRDNPKYVEVIAKVAATLEPGSEDCMDRQEKFEELIDQIEQTDDPIRHLAAAVMISSLAGFFVGHDEFQEIKDVLDHEPWFRLPNSRERRIHRHRPAEIRIVLDGPKLVRLRTHAARPQPFTPKVLLPYRGARAALPVSGVEPPKDHAEGAIQEVTASTACRARAALSRITVILALLRVVEEKRCFNVAPRCLAKHPFSQPAQ